MSEIVFKINDFDFLKPKNYIQARGIKWKRNDVDSADAGEMEDGTLRRDRVIIRRTLEITIIGPLTSAEIFKIMQAIKPQFINVTFNDPLEGKVITRTFYSNNVPATVMFESSGKLLWEGFTFPLIEQGVAGEGKA